jgi:hypothetical protein
VIFDLVAPQITPPTFLSSLAQDGVKVSIFPGTRRLRAVTHYGIERGDIDVALTAMQRAMAAK